MNAQAGWIIIPAFNEDAVLQDVLRPLLPLGFSIVVVDDGSTDQTAVIARRFPVHVLQHHINLGQGAALQTGMDYALAQGAEYLVTYDADGQMDPQDIQALCAPVIQGSADVAFGNRFMGSSEGIPFLRRVILKFGTWVSARGTGLRIGDAHNGFRCLNRKTAAAVHLRQNRMAHASELLYQIAHLQARYVEVPVRIRYTAYSLKKGQRTWGAIDILWDLLFH